MRLAGRITLSTIITALLVLIAAMGISATVISQDKGMSKVEQQYYKEMEKEYVKDLRALLANKGYSNSGVTMNRVINEDGSMEYLVTIHHKRISKLDNTDRQKLVAECNEIAFPMENCNFYHEFLETDL